MDFQEIGKTANEIEDEIGLNIDDILNKLTQELGEFNDAIQKLRGRYCKKKSENSESVKDEVGDLILNISSVLNRLGINPNDLNVFGENTLNKFKERKEPYNNKPRFILNKIITNHQT